MSEGTQDGRFGEQLDHYRIEDIVARGAVSTIYRAVDSRTNCQVAIKLPHPELENDPAFADRFRREAEIGKHLSDPGLIKALTDHDRSRTYLVMEWFEGKPLRQIMSAEVLSPERAVRIALAVSKTLEYIHNHGIVHRDLRPEHILVGAGDAIKLIDFGAAGDAAGRRITFTSIAQLTGGSEYISPEELKGSRGDRRSDLYALGIILYEMLTRRRPFPDSEPFDRVVGYPVPPRNVDPSLSPQLQEVIYRALEREPRNRYANAHDLAHDLEHLDLVGIADRQEMREWKNKLSAERPKALFYVAVALVPAVILMLLFYLASRGR